MATAKCFLCNKAYSSLNPDDLAGDGKCKDCKTKSEKIAFEVDMKMAEIRKKNPIRPKTKLQKFLENGGRINARDLDINSWGS